MNSILRNVFILLLAPSISLGSPSADVHTIAQNVDNRYNHIRTLQAEFTEVYRGAGMERTELGTLWLKKPGKMRWEYRSPKQKLFVSDGKDAWFYLPGDGQVRKAPVRKLDDLRSPLRLLLGKTRLEKELQGLSVASDVVPLTPGNVMLRGIPKGMADRASQVLLEITPESQIARIIIEEVDGAVTEYRFEQQRENVEASDQQFRFQPPPGVEMVEDDFGQ
jgi:outer membrane lipoprotein carrier protein